VVHTGVNLIPIEVKLSTTSSQSMAKGIEVFRKHFGKKALKGYAVHQGNMKLPLKPDAWAWPFADKHTKFGLLVVFPTSLFGFFLHFPER